MGSTRVSGERPIGAASSKQQSFRASWRALLPRCACGAGAVQLLGVFGDPPPVIIATPGTNKTYPEACGNYWQDDRSCACEAHQHFAHREGHGVGARDWGARPKPQPTNIWSSHWGEGGGGGGGPVAQPLLAAWLAPLRRRVCQTRPRCRHCGGALARRPFPTCACFCLPPPPPPNYLPPRTQG